MPTIGYISDLHLESWEGQTRMVDPNQPRLPYPLGMGPSLGALKEAGVSALILAGDIARGKKYYSNQAGTLDYARQASDYLGCPVILVPGNHEYYGGGDFATLRAELLASTGNGIFVLDRGECVIQVGDKAVRFLGATMWTDYLLSGDREAAMESAAYFMNDHRYIGKAGAHFSVEDALAEHRLSRAWMGEALKRPHAGPTVMVTHHVPHGSFRNTGFDLDHAAAGFCSNLNHLMVAATEAQVTAWVFGHHHFQVDDKVRGVRYLACQSGYPHTRIGFGGPKTFEI